MLYLFSMLVSYCYKPSVIVVFIFYVSLLLLQTICQCCIFFMVVSYCYKSSVIVVFIFYGSLILLQPSVIVVFIFYVSLLLLQTVCHCCIYFLC